MGEIAYKMKSGRFCACCGVLLEADEPLFMQTSEGTVVPLPDGFFNTGIATLCEDCAAEYLEEKNSLTGKERAERDALLSLQAKKHRYFSQQEYDRLKYLSSKMFKGDPKL